MESLRELYDMGRGFSVVYMIIDALGLASYFGTPMINVTWWYLTYAILLIASMPFVFFAYKKYRYLLLIICTVLSIFIELVKKISGFNLLIDKIWDSKMVVWLVKGV